MITDYVKIVRDDEGTVLDTQNCNGDIRALHSRIALLTQALEIEMEVVSNLRELLNFTRQMAADTYAQKQSPTDQTTVKSKSRRYDS